MAKAAAPKPVKETVASRLMKLIQPTLDAFLADRDLALGEIARITPLIGPSTAADADTVLVFKYLGYRAALMIQTATGLLGELTAAGHTERGEGGRSAAKEVGRFLQSRHIAAVNDAYEGIGKSVVMLARGRVPAFDGLLRWLDTVDEPTRLAFLHYLLARMALSARSVLPQPIIDRANLTFHACAVFLDALFKLPSGGAYQQYACAAFLHALLDEQGQIGPKDLRVETKKLNASDASSQVAGDIQIMHRNRLLEAFEVTANDWRTKTVAAAQTARRAGLPRVHIIAAVEPSFPDNSTDLVVPGVDLTAIDIQAFLRTLIAIMQKPARDAALILLYQHLDLKQPDVERVNAYVRLLRAHGLASP